MFKTLLGLGLFLGCGFAGVEAFKGSEYQKAAGFGLISLGGGALVLPQRGKARKTLEGKKVLVVGRSAQYVDNYGRGLLLLSDGGMIAENQLV